MHFQLSNRSKERLEGVKKPLIDVVNKAIEITVEDFGVTEGLRTFERQKELYGKGMSKTLDSKHLTGDAVDLVAYVAGDYRWEPVLYYNIADAMRIAAKSLDVSIRWGGAWHIYDLRECELAIKAHRDYLVTRMKEKKEPFIDMPHFELT